MAQISKSVQSNTYEGRYMKLTVWYDPDVDQDISTNKTTLHWKLQVLGGESSYYTVYNVSVYIDGSKKVDYGTVGWSEKKFPAAKGTKEDTVTLSHAADGSYPNVSFTLNGKVYSSGTAAHTDSIAIQTIPRATTPVLSASSITTGSALTITTTGASSDFTHELYWSFGNTTMQPISNNSWTPNANIFNQSGFYDKTSGTATITCITKNGGTEIGRKTATVTVNLASSVIPRTSNYSITKSGTDVNVVTSYVIGKNYPQVSLTGSGVQGSSISSYCYKYNNTTHSYATLAQLNSYLATRSSSILSGANTIEFWVVDSRGRSSAHNSTSITGATYSAPSITGFSFITRINSSNTADTNGEFARFSYSYTVKNVNGQNKHTLRIRARQAGTTTWRTYINIKSNVTVSTESFNVSDYHPIDTGWTTSTGLRFNKNYSYEVELSVYDSFSNSESTQKVVVSSAFDIIHVNAAGNGIAFGKKAETEQMFDCALNTKFRGSVTTVVNNTDFTNIHTGNLHLIKSYIANQLFPVGSIYISATPTNPSTIFGGSWTQLKNHFLFATNATSGDKGKDAMSESTGTNVTGTALSTDQIPAHTHGRVTLKGQWRSKKARFPGSSEHSGIITEWEENQSTYWSNSGGTDRNTVGWKIDASHEHASVGGGGTHNHQVPYIEVYVWQRTG